MAKKQSTEIKSITDDQQQHELREPSTDFLQRLAEARLQSDIEFTNSTHIMLSDFQDNTKKFVGRGLLADSVIKRIPQGNDGQRVYGSVILLPGGTKMLVRELPTVVMWLIAGSPGVTYPAWRRYPYFFSTDVSDHDPEVTHQQAMLNWWPRNPDDAAPQTSGVDLDSDII